MCNKQYISAMNLQGEGTRYEIRVLPGWIASLCSICVLGESGRRRGGRAGDKMGGGGGGGGGDLGRSLQQGGG